LAANQQGSLTGTSLDARGPDVEAMAIRDDVKLLYVSPFSSLKSPAVAPRLHSDGGSFIFHFDGRSFRSSSGRRGEIS